jgi:hypothetical protein
MSSAKLKEELKAASPFFDWAIGWRAREDKITLTSNKQSILISLKGWHTQVMHAACSPEKSKFYLDAGKPSRISLFSNEIRSPTSWPKRRSSPFK